MKDGSKTVEPRIQVRCCGPAVRSGCARCASSRAPYRSSIRTAAHNAPLTMATTKTARIATRTRLMLFAPPPPATPLKHPESAACGAATSPRRCIRPLACWPVVKPWRVSRVSHGKGGTAAGRPVTRLAPQALRPQRSGSQVTRRALLSPVFAAGPGQHSRVHPVTGCSRSSVSGRSSSPIICSAMSGQSVTQLTIARRPSRCSTSAVQFSIQSPAFA